MQNPLLGSGVPPGAIRFVLDTELPPGWCRFTGKDGLEYGGPLSKIPNGTTTGDMTIAGDIWESIHRYVEEHPEDLVSRESA